MQTAARAYLKTQVNTTSQGDILLLLYEGALKFLGQAKEKIAARDYAQKGILISRALDILAELQSSLNAQKGGVLAENLQKLYFICSTKLLQANLKMDTDIIDEVMRILAGLRDAFRTANAEVTGQPAPAAAVPNPSYGVAPPSMSKADAQPPRPASPMGLPGFAKRPAPVAPAAPTASPAPTAVQAPPVQTPAAAGIAQAAPAAPRLVVADRPAAPPTPPPAQTQSPMRRAFAAYATARKQDSAS
jgi:flagellar protein FliS